MRGPVGARKCGVGEHPFVPDPVAGDVNVLRSWGIHRRTSAKASICGANKALAHVQSRHETLVLHLTPPFGLKDIEKAREFVAVLDRVGLLTPREVFRDMDKDFSRGCEIRP